MKKDEFEFFKILFSNHSKEILNALCSSSSSFNKEFLQQLMDEYGIKKIDQNTTKLSLCYQLRKKIGTISFLTMFKNYWIKTTNSYLKKWNSNKYLKHILLRTKDLSKSTLFQYLLIHGETTELDKLVSILSVSWAGVDYPMVRLENELTLLTHFFSKMILELNNILFGISWSFSKIFLKINPSYWFSKKLKEKDLEIAITLKNWFEEMNKNVIRLRTELLVDPEYIQSLNGFYTKQERIGLRKVFEEERSYSNMLSAMIIFNSIFKSFVF